MWNHHGVRAIESPNWVRALAGSIGVRAHEGPNVVRALESPNGVRALEGPIGVRALAGSFGVRAFGYPCKLQYNDNIYIYIYIYHICKSKCIYIPTYLPAYLPNYLPTYLASSHLCQTFLIFSLHDKRHSSQIIDPCTSSSVGDSQPLKHNSNGRPNARS